MRDSHNDFLKNNESDIKHTVEHKGQRITITNGAAPIQEGSRNISRLGRASPRPKQCLGRLQRPSESSSLRRSRRRPPRVGPSESSPLRLRRNHHSVAIIGVLPVLKSLRLKFLRPVTQPTCQAHMPLQNTRCLVSGDDLRGVVAEMPNARNDRLQHL